jgi:hypothetical protein
MLGAVQQCDGLVKDVGRGDGLSCFPRLNEQPFNFCQEPGRPEA